MKKQGRQQTKKRSRQRWICRPKLKSGRGNWSRSLNYPSFVLGHSNANPEFIGAVFAVLQNLDFTDRQLFSRTDTALYGRIKQNGFWREVARLAVKKQSDLHTILRILYNTSLVKIPDIVMASLHDSEDRHRHFPMNLFEIVPSSSNRDFTVNFHCMTKRNIGGYPVYLPPRQVDVTIDGQVWPVAFSRHAIERICERQVYDWRSYDGYGDAFALYCGRVHIEQDEVFYNGQSQPAFCFHETAPRGFYVNAMIKHIQGDLDPSLNYGIRFGYCPLKFQAGHAVAVTTLFPGMGSTPEYGCLLRSCLPYEQKRKMRDLLNNVCYAKALDPAVLDVLKWFHENGVPQVKVVPRVSHRLPTTPAANQLAHSVHKAVQKCGLSTACSSKPQRS